MAYTKQTWLDRVGTFLNRFTKSNDTLSSVELVNNPGTITQAGTAFSASRMNYMESGIENAHRIATPLSDLSRVMRINGDGVPMFPDNVAGITQTFNPFINTTGFAFTDCTGTVVNGELVLTIANATWNIQFPVVSSVQNKLFRVVFTAPTGRDIKLAVAGSQVATLLNTTATGALQEMDVYNTIATERLMIFTGGGWSAGDIVKIKAEYIGSGLYDTPVYGKDGQIVATNNGVVPVNGKRGKGLLFQGAQYLESPDKLGTSGVIAFKYKKTLNGVNEYIISNLNFSDKSGVGLQIYADQVLRFAYGDGSQETFVSTNTGLVAGEDHDFVVNYAATTIGPVYRDGVQVLAQTNLPSTIKAPTSPITRIGCPLWTTGSQLLNGQLDDILVRSTPMTQDDAIRYHNGDDAVDSQQKSVTPVPHSIVTRDANGGINASNMFAYDLVIDSDAKLAQWAASGTWEKVLVKSGTWTLASGGVDLTARGTKCVIGEPESKLVFSSAASGLSYTSVPTTKDYRMDGVTVEATGTSNTVGFVSCTNMTNCTGTGTGTGTSNAVGFVSCTNMTNCTGTGTGTGTGTSYGFVSCTNMTNCTGTGTGTGTSYGFVSCKKCQQNTATGSTAKYKTSYADAGTAYPCADTPNGGFNS